ncbi:transcriptional regulator BetI [Oceanomicrobium pacificus]|uniref:HTH-type transcriptional regulator BetI n=1 Tax=Oceanomicrobium pacificus TaxID=2692916 RepID=A0A6B0TI82_9RHOB|nr:transcriptional regulator BetI [Oceanomicrobium pacificus]MXU64120.1 transcriptional regulator BetI [Oceanomicrobium pacificus]
MPKLGMEPIRRRALIEATILEVGQAGSLDVTVGQIAKRAGMSPALAHHYFGGKEQIFLAAMRQILSDFGTGVLEGLKSARSPRERIEAVIAASFAPRNFATETVAAWLTFYVQAQHAPDAQRLLQIYARRLNDNLVHDLSALIDRDAAQRLAQGIGAMIDGFYIRQALHRSGPAPAEAVAIIGAYIDQNL